MRRVVIVLFVLVTALILVGCPKPDRRVALPREAGKAKKEEGGRPAEKRPVKEKKAEKEKIAKKEETIQDRAEKALERLKPLVEEKLANNDFDGAIATVDEFLKEFGETELAATVKEKRAEIEKSKEEFLQAMLFKKADLIKEDVKRDVEALLVEENKDFDKALAIMGAFLDEYKETPAARELAGALIPRVAKLKEDWEKQQRLETEAKERYEESLVEVRKLKEQDRFDEAIAKLNQFPPELVDTEYGRKIGDLLNTVVTEKQQWEVEQAHIKEAERLFRGCMQNVTQSVEKKEFDRALKLLESYPSETYSDTKYPAQVQERYNSVVAERNRYMAFLREAEAEFERINEEADPAIEAKEFDKAIEILNSYPERYKGTRWYTRNSRKLAEVERKREEYREFLTAAGTKFEDCSKKVDSLTREGEYDKAIAEIDSFPADYLPVYEKALKMKKESLKEEKSKYERNKLITTVVIIIVIILIITIVIIAFLTAPKKGLETTGMFAATRAGKPEIGPEPIKPEPEKPTPDPAQPVAPPAEEQPPGKQPFEERPFAEGRPTEPEERPQDAGEFEEGDQ